MNKFFNSRSIIVISIVLAIVVVLFISTRSCGGGTGAMATISASEIALGEEIHFADSTRGAKVWLWEFGNGEYSIEQSGTYRFPEEGRYQIRLRVNNDVEKLFTVRVRPKEVANPQDQLIHISAPETAMQGEHIVFSGEGNDKEWRWEFGETGIIDSREKSTIYAYENHGTYAVRLSTENTQYPVMHIIEIFPRYKDGDSTDVMTMAGLDIKEKLQAIVDGKPFNTNYNHILSKYLCNNPNIIVTVNNSKRNDFYSYCQGLRMTGRNNTVIETVLVEASGSNSNCINQLMVLQYDKRSDSN